MTWNALVNACSACDLERIQQLLANFDGREIEDSARYSLLWAVLKTKTKFVFELLCSYPQFFDINFKGWEQYTLLHRCALGNYLESAQILVNVEDRVNIDELTSPGSHSQVTALWLASCFGFDKLCNLLCDL